VQRWSGFGGHAALEGQEDKVSAAADAEFIEQVGDVEFNSALGDVELAGDFLVGEVFEKRIQNFLFATAQVGDRIRFEAAGLARKDGVHETGENGAWYPKAAGGDERQSAHQLVASFGVSEDAFYAKAKQRKAGGVLVLFADDDEASIGVAFENIGEQCASGLAGGVRIDNVDLCLGWFKRTEIGSESGFELLGDDFEVGFGQKAFELAQHERMRREQANRQLRTRTFSSHLR
jgi:hypothetical protein